MHVDVTTRDAATPSRPLQLMRPRFPFHPIGEQPPRDCVLRFPLGDGEMMLISYDDRGVKFEELRTPLHRVDDAERCLIDRMRDG